MLIPRKFVVNHNLKYLVQETSIMGKYVAWQYFLLKFHISFLAIMLIINQEQDHCISENLSHTTGHHSWLQNLYKTSLAYAILPHLVAQTFISFQQLFTPTTIQDRHLLLEIINQSFWVMNSNGSSQHSCSRSTRCCAP